MIKKFVYIFGLLSLTTSIIGQVTISPTALFIDSQRRFETLLILNSSNVAQEISLSFDFGYPESDEEGNLGIIYDDTEQEALHSAADWIRGFPKNFILEPGARQVVRITAKAPGNLADGTYWSRLRTTSSAVSTPVGEAPQGEIAAQINFKFSQVTSIFYKHGELNTSIVLTGIRHKIEEDQLGIFAEFTKTGNSPYLGTMVAQVFDADGKIVKEGKVFVSIYYDGLRRLNVEVDDLPSGEYEAAVTFHSGRADIPDTDITVAPTVSIRGRFTK